VLKRFMGLAGAVLVAALLQAQISSSGPASGVSAIKATSKTATALDLSGKSVDVFATSRGKPLVLVFVRTDCPISNRYAPTLEAMNKKYGGESEMMLVYPDKTETAQNIQKHLTEYGYKMTAVRDPQHDLVKLSEVQITPEVAVFNGNRELIYHGRIDNWYKDFGHARSAPTTHELEEAIQSALGNGHSAPASVGGVGCYISDLQ